MKFIFLVLTLGLSSDLLFAQKNQVHMDGDKALPFYEIPDHPPAYTAEAVAARMIEGLGFRFYWATEGLRAEDLSYQPSEGARTTEATVDHILGLTNMIVNAVRQQPNGRGGEAGPQTFAEKRRRALENLEAASEQLRSGAGQLKEYPIVFQRGDDRSELPFWNLINGPIADAIWHTGQLASFRRSSGNPISSGISFMSGAVRQ